MGLTGWLYWNFESSQQTRSVAKVHRMGGSLAYRYAGLLFDIAILEVDATYTLNANVVVAKLPTAKTPIGTEVTVSGWGTTSEGINTKYIILHEAKTIIGKMTRNLIKLNIKKLNIVGGQISCTLRQVSIPTVSKVECNKYYNYTIKSSQICAGLKEGGKDACQVNIK